MRFESHGIASGCWQGILVSDNRPAGLSVVHRGQVVAEATLCDAGSGLWSVAASLPPSVIDEGVHCLLLIEAGSTVPGSPVLGRLELIAGTAAGDDLVAEITQLRAELDLLKREFRRFAADA